MEDDGMLLNFATLDTPLPQRVTKVTGGKWKDRRKLQLSLQGRGRDDNATGVNTTKLENSRLDRGEKKDHDKKDKDKKRSSNNEGYGISAKRVRYSETSGLGGGKNGSYVSSIFTNGDDSTLVHTKEAEKKTYLPSNAPLKDATTFDGLGLNEKLAKHLTETLRFKHPTRIQQLVIPNLLTTQRDLFVKAQTGSGKTLAFLLPIFHQLMMENTHKITRESGLFAIILAPTRELATQIYGVMETLTRCYHHIVPGIVIGGEKKKSEKARLRKGVNILVATPGRLADHIENTTVFDVSQLRYLILDEGDKLVELGFEETITKITEHITQNSKIAETVDKWQGLPTKRVNLLCSATMQNNVQKLGSIILNNAEMISVEGERTGTVLFNDLETGGEATAPDQLIQDIVVLPPKLRLVALEALLRKTSFAAQEPTRSLVFFSCSDSVNFHFDVFTRGGKRYKKVKNEDGKMEETLVNYYKDEEDDSQLKEDEVSVLTAPLVGPSTDVFKLHGSLSQNARTSTLQAFIKSKAKHSVLLCTDVASRGLDMPNIASVIEYDPPFSVDDHLHRIGRSARVGNEGRATLFLLPGNEEGYVDGKIKIVHPKKGNLRIVNYETVLKEGFAQVDEESEKPSTKVDPRKRFGKWDIHATTWHLEVERWLLEDQTAHDRAVQAFTSHIRAYATHLSAERNFFNVKTLHLGHLAKSFGLRETPKKLGKSVGSNNGGEGSSTKPKKEDPRKKMLRMAKMAVRATSSEFHY